LGLRPEANESDTVPEQASTYRHPYLKQIVTRVDLANPLEYLPPAIDRVAASVRGVLPTADTQQIFSMQVTVGPRPTFQQNPIGKVYRFVNRETSNTLVLEPNSIILDIRTYVPYSVRRNAIQSVIDSLQERAGSLDVSRTGIRYINTIVLESGDPFDWTGLITDSLLASMSFAQNHEEVARATGSFYFAREICDILFQYGLFNSEFPNPIARKEFLLDIDCFTTEPSRLATVSATLDVLRTEANGLFERCIQDDLRNLMRREIT